MCIRDRAYFTYIDFRTLGLLFCLMAIVAGLKAVGVFDILAQKLLMGTSGTVGDVYKRQPSLIILLSSLYKALFRARNSKNNDAAILLHPSAYG